MSTTGKALLEAFVEEHGLGKVGDATAAGSSTTVVDASLRFKGPLAGNEWARGDVVRITSGTRVSEESMVDDYDPTTGTFTLSPALTGAPGSGADFVVIKRKFADSTDRLWEALTRGLRRTMRRDKVAMTQGGYGAALLAETTTLWGTSNATLAYLAGDTQDFTFSRGLEVTATAGNGYGSLGISGVRAGEVYDLYVPAVQPYANSSVAQVVVRDLTNTAAITPVYTVGSASISGNTPQDVVASFTIPAGCFRVEIRYLVVTSGHVAAFGPLFVMKRGSLTLPFPPEITDQAKIGQFYTVEGMADTASGLTDRLTPWNGAVSIVDRGFGLVAQFEETPPFPLLCEALVPYLPVASETATTDCPQEVALAAMAYEFWPDLAKKYRDDKGQSPYDQQAADAAEEWGQFRGRFGQETIPVIRRQYAGRVGL